MSKPETKRMREQRKGRKRRIVNSGHPSRLAEIKHKIEPEEKALDATQSVIQKMLRQLQEEAKRGAAEDGVIVAPLMVAARYAAEVIARDNSDIDQDMLARWLCARLGETIAEADLDEFRAWDLGRRNRLVAV